MRLNSWKFNAAETVVNETHLQSESNKLEGRQPNLLIRGDTLNTALDWTWMDGGLLFVSASHTPLPPVFEFVMCKKNTEIWYNFRCTFGNLGDHKAYAALN